MPAKDFGTKFLCFKCTTKFYDMKKPDPICPKCGADQREATVTKSESRRSRLSAAPKIVEAVEPVEGAAEEEEIEAEADEEIAADED
ncbi:MAG: TIGR02300 family protein [Myxococcus sp.]|nr:TIGR02300 family protein [Myxococcus sp.]